MSDRHHFAHRYGPWALVAGGSEGIGEAFAWRLAERGLRLWLVARRAQPLRELAARLEAQQHVQVRVSALDLADAGQLAELEKSIDAVELGMLVCNAALAPIGPFVELPIERLEQVIDLNCRATTRLVRAVAPRLVARGRGGIVLVTSMAGLQGTPLVAQYSASKAFLRVLGEGLWHELKPAGVDVVAAVAGKTRTPTYLASAPAGAAWLGLGPMAPDVVARQTLQALGRQPVVVPGLRNQLATWAAERLLPRALAVRLAAAGTRAMYR